jgi:hypothetical protein
MIVAKPVIENQYWILQKDNQKVGNIEARDGGFQVKIHNSVNQYRTIDLAAQRADITFVSAGGNTIDQKTNLVHGYPAAGRVHNAVWNIPLKLPLFTRSTKSKSWFAAGWYAVYRNRTWRAIYTPKLIALQRYKYRGPFQTEQQAQQVSAT